MSDAQISTFQVLESQGKINLSNEEVRRFLKAFTPEAEEPAATAENLIFFISGNRQMSAVNGKRLSQPVYRALSELADQGIVSDDETAINPDTGYKNTLYRLLKVPRPPRVKKNTWKEKALKLQEEIENLKKRNQNLLDLCRGYETLLEVKTQPES